MNKHPSLDEINKKIQNLKKNEPKLGVYTSTDGSVYSKPNEVQAKLSWLKELHYLLDLKKKEITRLYNPYK